MEIKNKLTITRGEGEEGNRGKKGKGWMSRNRYKGPMHKDKWWGGLNVGGEAG